MPGFQLSNNQIATEFPSSLQTFLYRTNALALAVGDVVQAQTNTTATNPDGLKQVVRVTDNVVSQLTVGVVMGMAIDPDNEVVGIPSSSADRAIYVNISPDAVYEVDCSVPTTPSSQAIDLTDIGLNLKLSVAASTVGSLSTSGMLFDSDVPALVSNTYPWRIVGISEFATSDNTTYASKVLVRANLSYLQNGTGA